MSPVWDEFKKTGGASQAKKGASTTRGPTPTTTANLKASYNPSSNAGRQGSTS